MERAFLQKFEMSQIVINKIGIESFEDKLKMRSKL